MWSEEKKILCHEAILEVGEGLRCMREAEVEQERQKAIRSTEEVVRREETQRRDRELEEARQQWKRERQQLFVEAHQSQLRAVAKHAASLEKELRREFADRTRKMVAEHEAALEAAVKSAWEEAGRAREAAVEEARLEEKGRAKADAERVMEEVAEERRAGKRRAELEKARELEIGSRGEGVRGEMLQTAGTVRGRSGGHSRGPGGAGEDDGAQDRLGGEVHQT
ncbi:hypothetical protein GBAR_LOCUS1643, partial [Geodia barretti]